MLNFDLTEDAKNRVTVDGPYGSHDIMRQGMISVAHNLAPKHPIQQSIIESISVTGSPVCFFFNQ